MAVLARRIAPWFACLLLLPCVLHSAPAERVVVIARNLSDADYLRLQAAVVCSPDTVLLWDGRKSAPGNARLVRQLGNARTEIVETTASVDSFVAATKTKSIVVAPPAPRESLIRSACLAAATKSHLLVKTDSVNVADFVKKHGVEHVIWTTETKDTLAAVKFRHLPDADAVTQATIKANGGKAIVVANPTDPLANLAPTITARTGGAIVFTNAEGDAETAIRSAAKIPSLAKADALVILGSPTAIPCGRRDNPIAGRDQFIEMEPLTPEEADKPVTYATGRLFHEDPGVVLQMLARSLLLPSDGSPRTALVASNPGSGLPLLETMSRTSARELSRRGYDTTGLFGRDVTGAELRRQWPKFDLVLWEGHHNTLMFDYGFPSWTEPLPPSLVIMQSCISLHESKVSQLLDRGSLAIVGSSSRIYSGTGGAFSLAYLDAMIYDNQSLGGSLRQAKNFLIAYTMLKEKKFNGSARLNGANMRSAWAFSLWGDPTLKLPKPMQHATECVTAKVKGDSIIIHVPASETNHTIPGRYDSPDRPNGRLAGLMHPADDAKELASLIFAEVPMPKIPADTTPQLTGKHAEKAVLLWDGRRKVGYLLTSTASKDEHDLRFRLTTEAVE